MPAFGPLSIRGMFDEMHDISSQLALKWARYGETNPIYVTDDFTRLTLDTLALCSMGFRFNSFYSPQLHPFLEAMGDFLVESGTRSRRPPLPSVFYRSKDQKFEKDIVTMRDTAKGVLESRKAGDSGHAGRRDLLTAMLEGVDPKTGKHMNDESIMDNLITFLIAGHETTSGLLSFAFYQLLKHPEAYRKAQQEVDDVVGKGTIKVDHLSKLPYINAVLRETLRINSSIPFFMVEAREDTTLGDGKYEIKKGQPVINLLAKAHLDPKVYGETAGEFVPERMLDAEFEKLNREFPNCWKPFGNGVRGCIGRPFAWQEALLVMTMLLQNFNFVLDPQYVFDLKQTLTIKPKNMHMRAILRDGLTPTSLERRLSGLDDVPSQSAPKTNGAASNQADGSAEGTGTPLTLLYGSNSGTCEALAQRIASDAPSHGFRATKVDCLDSANGTLPKGQPVVIVTSSYEGQPPDNAGHFVAWVEGLQKEAEAGSGASPLSGVDYAVFGCGNKDWVQTFHRVPKLVDSAIEKAGGARVASIGLSDVSAGTVFSDFETWEDDVLWPALDAKYKGAKADGSVNGEKSKAGAAKMDIEVTVSNPRTSTLRQDVKEGMVAGARVLTSAEGEGAVGEVKKHIEIQLPEGMTYKAGDYLAVLPTNPVQSVNRVLRRFHLARDAYLSISTDIPTSLPLNESVPAFDVLSSYVELSQPATKRVSQSPTCFAFFLCLFFYPLFELVFLHLTRRGVLLGAKQQLTCLLLQSVLTLADCTTDEATRKELTRLANEGYADEISAKRVSVLDLLEEHPSVELPIGQFLALMPPMRVRQYSISSSPLANPSSATLTIAVLDKPSLSGTGHRHMGVASTYLDSLEPGDRVQVTVRKPAVAFRLPADPTSVPIVCIAAGSGLAPFRAFFEERAAMISAGRLDLAPALLFFGCRSPDQDDLYREELDAWERAGAVSVRRAYSRDKAASEGCGYVQDRMWHDRRDVLDLWRRDAKVYICGSRRIANAARDMAVKIAVERQQETGGDKGEEDLGEWLDSLRNVRYVMDVFD